MKLIYFLVISLISSQSFAEGAREVPDKLFGISLGAIYDIGNPDINDFGSIPVKKFTGMNKSLGSGFHYYFQPKVENKFFEYIEKRKNPEDKYFETSFRLYLLPVIPATIKTVEQLEKAKLKYEVSLIEWSSEPKTEEDGYFWSLDVCKTFAADIELKPTIIDNYESKWYECSFSYGNREFKVSSAYSKSVKLSYKRETLDNKNNLVESKLRKLQANKIRPY